jgi:conjugal transfer mating pair stabilization protein TraN
VDKWRLIPWATTPAAQSGGVQLDGGAAVAGMMLSTLMAAYTVAMIAIMIFQILWSCEIAEYELAAKKQLKSVRT